MEDHVKGIALVGPDGRVVGALGQALDPAVRTVITDLDWLRDAGKRRLVMLQLKDVKLAILVKEFKGAYLVIVSAGLTDTVSSFLLMVDFAYDIINHVLTDPYDAMVVVDADARMTFISPVHEKFFGLQSGEGQGRQVRDVIENTHLHNVVRTGVAEVGQIQKMRGGERIVSRHPIWQDGKIAGAIGRIMFKGPQQVEALARRVKSLENEIATYKAVSEERARGEEYLEAIVGQSDLIQSVRQQIRKIAPLDIPVLIQGESGTGKELVAQALHMMSARADGRLVTVNAAALPDSLVESELFGYEAGSFTGADRKGRPGKFEMADKGTMFLDEIGDMPIDTQSKLLRVLQDKMVERLGGDKPKRVDFRLCSATNRDLEDFIEQGRFRLDLFYRISPVTIVLPALRDRYEDIPLLVAHFLRELCKQHNRDVPEIDPTVYDLLMEQPWPGNIRQLRHEIESAVVLSESQRLTVDDFRRKAGQHPVAKAVAPVAVESPKGENNLKDALVQLENDLIHETLVRFRGNKKKAAEHLGISRSYLYKKLEELQKS
ncbi:sigma-54 interaction domain-containing protein [Devosia sp. A369]